MILLEGPDGSGKSTLVTELLQRFPQLTVHPKFVPSSGVGDRTEIYDKVCEDTAHFIERPIQIYDRHPMISEYVYGPVVRNHLPQEWQSPSARLMRGIIANHALVVWCLPGLETVKQNISQDRDMDGVVDNIAQIYNTYLTVKALWPGHCVTYNYQEPLSGFVFNRIQMHIEKETKLRNESSALHANPQGVQQ